MRSQRTNEDGNRFRASFPSSVAALVEPRMTFEQWLTEDDVPDDIVSELTVVFSELTSNAAAVSPDDGGEISAEAWRQGDDLVMTVENSGPISEVAVRHWDLEDALRSGGRGLMIVRAYTDSMDATSTERGSLLVRCRRRITRR